MIIFWHPIVQFHCFGMEIQATNGIFQSMLKTIKMDKMMEIDIEIERVYFSIVLNVIISSFGAWYGTQEDCHSVE